MYCGVDSARGGRHTEAAARHQGRAFLSTLVWTYPDGAQQLRRGASPPRAQITLFNLESTNVSLKHLNNSFRKEP